MVTREREATGSGLSSGRLRLRRKAASINGYSVQPPPPSLIGGRLTHFLEVWSRLSHSGLVAQAVSGYKLEFANKPPMTLPSRQLETGTATLSSRRCRPVTQQGGHREGAFGCRLLQSHFSCAKEEWSETFQNQIKNSKLFPEKETVPSSHYQQRVQDIEVRRLGSFTGSDRCLLSCSSPHSPQEVPTVPVAGSMLPVPVFALRAVNKPTDIHVASKTPATYLQKQGNKSHFYSGFSIRDYVVNWLQNLGFTLNRPKCKLSPDQIFQYLGLI